jgi:HSP20 family protein
MYEMMPYGRDGYSRRHNPFRELEELEKHFFSNPLTFFEKEESFPIRTDIRDCTDYYLLEADLPGFDKNDIKIAVAENILTVSACKKREDKTEQKGNFIRCERFCGCYTRQFELIGIDKDKISAKYENGVLTLELYKKEEEKKSASKEIKIQ